MGQHRSSICAPFSGMQSIRCRHALDTLCFHLAWACARASYTCIDHWHISSASAWVACTRTGTHSYTACIHLGTWTAAAGKLEWQSPLSIIRYPDPRLRAVNARIQRFDSQLKRLADEMFEVMYNGYATLCSPLPSPLLHQAVPLQLLSDCLSLSHTIRHHSQQQISCMLSTFVLNSEACQQRLPCILIPWRQFVG